MHLLCLFDKRHIVFTSSTNSKLYGSWDIKNDGSQKVCMFVTSSYFKYLCIFSMASSQASLNDSTSTTMEVDVDPLAMMDSEAEDSKDFIKLEVSSTYITKVPLSFKI